MLLIAFHTEDGQSIDRNVYFFVHMYIVIYIKHETHCNCVVIQFYNIIIRVEEVYISVFEHCRKRKFRTFLHLTLLSKFFILSQLSDFVECVVQVFIFGILGLEHNLKLKFSMSTHLAV